MKVTDILVARHLYGTFSVPGGVYNVSIRLNVSDLLTDGDVFYDSGKAARVARRPGRSPRRS